jgi:phosphatidylglycerophosphate synthase
MIQSGLLRLDSWSRAHAVSMLGASSLAALLGRPWPLAVVAAGSFGALLLHARGRFTKQGEFGLANGITAFRLLVALLLAALLHGAPGWHWCAAVLTLLALDGLDGALARRRGSASAFGAHFDMETDAFTVLVVVFELWQRGAFGAWVLTAGLLRYLYVVGLALLPSLGGEAPRSLLARYAFLILMLGLAAGLALPQPFGSVGPLVGTLVIALSFARSFYFGYASRSSPGE